MTPDIFQKAHADAIQAVHLFLPSLAPPPQMGPTEPPPPKQNAEPLRALSVARHVEQMSKRVTRGLPPEEPKPTPEQQFGPELDPVHIRALSAAIAAHPEDERAKLVHEAHESLVTWIGSHNGRVVIDGHIELAHTPEAAERLAAKIINGAVDDHDQREAAKAQIAQEAKNSRVGTAGNESTPATPAATDDGVLPLAPAPAPAARPVSQAGDGGPDIVPPGGTGQIR